jgi:hypothetical protein
MSAPERIWVDPGAWEIVAAKTRVEPDYDVHYIRKDASDAAIAAARAEGVREGMLKAAEIADQHRDPTGTEYGEGWDASASSITKEVRAAAEAQP